VSLVLYLRSRDGVVRCESTEADTRPHSRLAPPLVISEEDLDRAVDIIEECLRELDSVEDIADLSVHAGSTTFVSL